MQTFNSHLKDQPVEFKYIVTVIFLRVSLHFDWLENSLAKLKGTVLLVALFLCDKKKPRI